ncbi:MAG TPA: G1 family glutamic endopeptidase [Trebonia sp.]|nr:G1 family glutamic endopeptidase [Trebonia sp.]
MASKAPSASFVAQARAHFIKDLSSHATALGGGAWKSPGAEHVGNTTAANGTVSEFPSYNWSGYADSESGSKTVSYVSGDWTMPAVTCPTAPYENSDAFLANWVGIDGFTNSTVEQLGTGAQCYEGVTFYYVWYEMFPAGTVEEGTTACINNNVNCPQPGDQISASVTASPGASGENNYTLTLVDHTRAKESFSTSASCATATCLDQSGEWVIERPAFSLPFGFQILPLADFHKTTFSAGDIESNGKFTNIQGFKDGPVYDMPMQDDSTSYYLDCVDQPSPPGSLLSLSDPSSCPTATPTKSGGFETSWDAGF